MNSPFDSAAASYDADFSATQIGRWLRGAVWQQIAELFQPGDRVLDLGCGTGEDALWLARRGVAVTALDSSAAMLAVARQKLATEAGAAVAFMQADLRDLDGLALPIFRPLDQLCFDGALANFGALNCLPDRRALARWLAARIAPGGKIALVLMGPICAWEIGWHLLHGDLRRAVRRMAIGSFAHAGGGGSLQVWFPSARQLIGEFASSFRPVGQYAIGALLPPPYLEPLVMRAPQLFRTLALLDRRLASSWPLPLLSDHYLLTFERRSDV